MQEKHILIYEPNYFQRAKILNEINNEKKDRELILLKEEDSFIPTEITSLALTIEDYKVDSSFENKILIFFFCHYNTFLNEILKSHGLNNHLIIFSSVPFVMSEYLLTQENSENRDTICLVNDQFINKIYSKFYFFLYKNITNPKMIHKWMEFFDKNALNSSALKEYLEFLFQQEVFEFLFFKIYLESTFKRSFEYPIDLKFTCNKIYKLTVVLEQSKISHCVVKNKVVASVIQSIIERKKLNVKVCLFSELENVKENDLVFYFDFGVFLENNNGIIMIPEENKNYFLALAAKENLLFNNLTEEKMFNYFVIDSIQSFNFNLRCSFEIKEDKFYHFSSTRVEKTEYKKQKYFEKIESITKKIKAMENNQSENQLAIFEQKEEINHSEIQKEFSLTMENKIVILEIMKKINPEDFLSVDRKIKHKKYYDDKTLLFVKCTIDLLELIEEIYSLIKEPIFLRNFPEHIPSTRAFIHNIKFGSVPSFFNFVDFYYLQGSGTISFNNYGIIILYNSLNKSYKIELSTNSFEEYIFVSYDGKRLFFTFLLQKFDKIFIKENTYYWKRVSINEVPFLENKFDIQLQADRSTFFNLVTYFSLHNLCYTPINTLSHLEYSNLLNNKDSDRILGIKSIKKFFSFLPFEEYYYLECLLSQKARFINLNLKESDLLKIKQSPNFIALILKLHSEIKERFINLPMIIEKNYKLRLNYEKSTNLIKVAFITPLRIIYHFPVWSDSNRILREFMLDKFIRFNFREEDSIDQIIKRSDYDNSPIFDHFRTLLLEGIFIGKKKFFFLAMSSSQLRQHSCLFVTPYFNNTIIGPEYIREWMGDFRSIHNIGKCAARLGQCLSTTFPTLKVIDFAVEKDYLVGEYNFTDGIGMISFSFAKRIAHKFKLPIIPSAYQIRFAGFKGVLALCDIKNDIILRESMKKFESNHRILEVIGFSQRRPCFLNRQVISILESLGIKKNIFMKLNDLTIRNTILVPKTTKSFIESINNNLSENENENNFLLEVKEKCRLYVNKGRTLMGVIDELGILEENEIFMMSKLAEEDTLDEKVKVVDNHLVLTSEAFIAKNPCLHPGDIRIVKGVDRKELYHYKEVLVFSKKGKRPIFNMCSGSDLDGDIFIISWEETLIPKKTILSDEYFSSMYLYKENVTVTDIINFFVRFMQEDQIGLIANAHSAHADKKENGVLSPECVRLAQLFNMGIDFPKTGYIASLPYDLQCNEVPDFLSTTGGKKYLSDKIIGIIYRRSCHLMIEKEILCECNNCFYKVTPREKVLYYSCRFNGRKEKYESNVYLDKVIEQMYDSFRKENSLFVFEKYSQALKEIPGTWEEKYASYKKIRQSFHSYFDFLINSHLKIKEDFFLEGKNESFIFHDRIFFKEGSEKIEEYEDYIIVYTGVKRNNTLKMLCPIDSVPLFNELFLLLLAGNFIRIEEFDFIFSLFEFLFDMMSYFTKEYLAEVIFLLSGMFYETDDLLGLEKEFTDYFLNGSKLVTDNKKYIQEQRSNMLLLIAYLLMTDIPLKYKIKVASHFSKGLLYKVEEKGSKIKEKVYIKYYNEIVMVGMFDSNDEVFLQEKNRKYYLKLLNDGKSTIQVYKDIIRQFIVSHALSTDDGVTVTIEPGYLYFYDLSNYYKCNNFKLKKLREVISFGKKGAVNASFVNESPLMYKEHINEYLKNKGLSMLKEESTVEMEFIYKENKYYLQLDNKFKVIKISINRVLLGRLQILNEKKNCNLLIHSDKLIYVKEKFTFNNSFYLNDELSFILQNNLLKYENNKFKINNLLNNKEITDLSFNVCLTCSFGNKRSIQELVYVKTYDSKCNEINETQVVKSRRILGNGHCDYAVFESYFMKIWDDLCLLID